jgi:hypothetical protein
MTLGSVAAGGTVSTLASSYLTLQTGIVVLDYPFAIVSNV